VGGSQLARIFVERFCQAGSVCALFNFMNRLVKESRLKGGTNYPGIAACALNGGGYACLP
jgi:hypothetical protein